MHIHADTYTYMHMHAYTCICVHIHAYTCIYMHRCMHMCSIAQRRTWEGPMDRARWGTLGGPQAQVAWPRAQAHEPGQTGKSGGDPALGGGRRTLSPGTYIYIYMYTLWFQKNNNVFNSFLTQNAFSLTDTTFSNRFLLVF